MPSHTPRERRKRKVSMNRPLVPGPRVLQLIRQKRAKEANRAFSADVRRRKKKKL